MAILTNFPCSAVTHRRLLSFYLSIPNALQLIFKQLRVQGFFLGFFDHEKKVLPAIRAAAPLVASGALHVPVAAIYPLSRIREAVDHLVRGGKILLEVQKLN